MHVPANQESDNDWLALQQAFRNRLSYRNTAMDRPCICYVGSDNGRQERLLAVFTLVALSTTKLR